ncbi:MAG: molybdopterin molybdotransferase MoeA [Aigarchaeota archaeon]|nr:molybdopterin molybdotransferase MoeA [Candidatus Pelearchaeum maunauluense]
MVQTSPKVLSLTPLDKALSLIKESLSSYVARTKTIQVEDSIGYVAAEDVFSSVDIPPYPKAAVDGVAARSGRLGGASLSNPVRLRLVRNPIHELQEGEAVFVSTGDGIPSGANVVVKIENVRLVDDDYAEVVVAVPEGKNIIPEGYEIKVGDKLVEKGRRIKPEDTALLMEAEVDEVLVYERPKIGLIPVGDDIYLEFMKSGIKGANYSFLAAKKINEFGGDVVLIDPSPDDVDTLSEKIFKASKTCDAIFTVGGCSIGRNDIVHRTVAGMSGARILFHGLKYNPAKPSGYALIGSTPLLMLPGHVVSMVGALHLLGKPLINHLQGLAYDDEKPIIAKVAADQKLKPGMGNMVLVRLERRDKDYLAWPLSWGTNSIKNLVIADGFVLVDEGDLKAGQQVDVFPL